jgi:hypothetical protein
LPDRQEKQRGRGVLNVDAASLGCKGRRSLYSQASQQC